ncbi:MAG: HAD hydrolase-like protein [Clostridiaceae bacterium]|nr:HAD hydrolase-like protein [Clostridiaceae bacterium]
MAIKAIIFDLDGTLLDTLEDLAKATNQVLSGHGLPSLPVERYKKLVGAGARNLMSRAWAAAGGTGSLETTALDDLVAGFKAAYDQGWAIRTQPYPGLAVLLEKLLAAGFRLAVLSNKPDEFTQQMIRRYFPAIEFNAVSGMLAGWPPKPDPALALELCRRMGVTSGETALAGDSGSDMETAVRAGFRPLGVLWGFRSAEELRQNGAAELFINPDELAGYLLSDGERQKGAL